MARLNFILEAEAPGSSARAARFTTLHGEVKTPIFMPVGTQATVKSQTVSSLKEVGSNVLLANTYHLLLRPGPEVMRKFGGIHAFMNWDKPVLTDSGGFQIFSLPHSREMNEKGALFKSYVDNRILLLSPEVSIETQKAINSDIMMVLDQCIPSTAPHAQAKLAMELTHRWARRSLLARGESRQSMFAIVQGACYPELRKQSAEILTQIFENGESFDGFAIGGLAVGESKAEREDFTELTASYLPKNLPRYLMGVGTPLDILEAVHRGVDMFDCIIPSQFAQRGIAFTSQGKFQLRRSVYKFQEARLDPDCPCQTCADYSLAYLHHLVKTEETLGWHLLALHNLTFYHRLMQSMRESILQGSFLKLYQEKRIALGLSDEARPVLVRSRIRADKKAKNQKLGNYEIVPSSSGYSQIRQLSSGETMHSVSKPAEEARTLYVNPSRVRERLGQDVLTTVWDVGLGAASNAMELIMEVQSQLEIDPQLPGHFQIISFENDLDALKLACKNKNAFPYLRHPGPSTILETGRWQSADGKIFWLLKEGDFLEQFSACAKPDLIYYDPFSAAVDHPLWTAETFRKIALHLQSDPFQLMTYTESTLIRALLLSEGLWVGYGPSSGPKSSTTQAFNSRELAEQRGKLLGPEWLSRFSRSQAQFPQDLNPEQQQAFVTKIKKHSQFGNLLTTG